MVIDYKKIPLFGQIGDIVLLKENVDMSNGEILNKGSTFQISNIINFGFDLRSLENNEIYRFLNSEMFKYFEKV